MVTIDALGSFAFKSGHFKAPKGVFSIFSLVADETCLESYE